MAKASKQVYSMSIRCHYGNEYNMHRVALPLKDIEKWVEAYRYTHPNVDAFSIKIWTTPRDCEEDV